MNDYIYKLPVEENSKIDADEMEGEYLCKRCKGWGYIVKKRMSHQSLTSFPLDVCPECEGGGVIDWVKRTRQG